MTLPSLALLSLALTPGPDLSTLAEQSGFKRTGRYEEVTRLCAAFAKAYPRKARCETFGTTPERRPMVALILSDDGALRPETARAKKRPVVLLQGGIHAGEIDGKDAGFWLLRDVMAGKVLPGVLQKLTLVFVPVFNVDGHERFGPNNRPNQVGPEEMGWRVTSQNLNLNRDYLKAEAPEMQAMLRYLLAWDPILYADLHVTDGAKFQHDISLTFEPQIGSGETQVDAVNALREEVVTALANSGHLPLTFYPSFVRDDDPTSGFAVASQPPRFSTAYWGLHDRLSVLVETHSWKDYATRVKATRDALTLLLTAAARDGQRWMEGARTAQARPLAGTPVVISYAAGGTVKRIPFHGYAYTRERSSLSGAMWTRYDDTKPEVWTVPFLDELYPSLTVSAPRAGYVVPGGFAERVASKLSLHGLTFSTLETARSRVPVEVFRATKAARSSTSFEGRQTLAIEGAWTREVRDLPAGSLYVPLNQRWAVLVMHLLEPLAPDSMVAWGFFNAAFEQKEYLEDYVLEEEARQMLKREPGLKAKFEADAGVGMRFFAERHPSWDERLNLVPVFRVDAAP